jgi:hypothetical protein
VLRDSNRRRDSFQRSQAAATVSQERVIEPRRRQIVYAFVVVLLLAHAWVVATGDEHFPILAYPMFAWEVDGHYECVAVFGVSQNGEEFALDDSQTSPTGSDWLHFAMLKVLHFPRRNAYYGEFLERCSSVPEPDREACAQKGMAEDTLEWLRSRYEQRKAGPPLRALRVYDADVRPEIVHRAEGATVVKNVLSKRLLFEHVAGGL